MNINKDYVLGYPGNVRLGREVNFTDSFGVLHGNLNSSIVLQKCTPKQERLIRGIVIGKEATNMSQFVDIMIVYVKNPNKYTKKQLN